jgi:hypothetical protein
MHDDWYPAGDDDDRETNADGDRYDQTPVGGIFPDIHDDVRGQREMGDLDDMIAWENGELDDDGTVALFQRLVNSGLAWSLQGAYGRQAMALIRAGYVHSKENTARRTQHENK